MVRAFTDHVRLSQCPAQIATLDGTIDQLENEYEDVTGSLNLAKAEADSLNAQISGSSANIAPLQSQVTAAETEAEQVERRRAAYEDMLTAQDIDIPDTAAPASIRLPTVERIGRQVKTAPRQDAARHRQPAHRRLTTSPLPRRPSRSVEHDGERRSVLGAR